MKRATTHLLWISLGLATCLLPGCSSKPYGGECDTVEDLDPEYFEGAACVNGMAGCDNGAELCFYLKPDKEDKMRLRHGCLAEQCIRCEEGEFLCAFMADEAAKGDDWAACYPHTEDCAGRYSLRL